MHKKPTIITGSCNSFGYVLRKNGHIFYAAGNCPHESQSYIGIVKQGREFVKSNISVLGEHFGLLSREELELRCKNTVEHIVEKPELYGLPENPLGYVMGEVAFSANLNPMEAAFKCGALT